MPVRVESVGLRGRVDWAMAAAAAGLVLIGSVAILSAASPMPHYPAIVQRHFLALAVGIAAFLFGAGFNYQIYQDQSRTVYALTLAVLVAVLLAGDTMRGQKSWFRFPYFSFQPSELARIATVLVLANYLDRKASRIEEVGSVLGAFAIAGPVMVLVLAEPDFSSTLIYFPVLVCMLFCAGASALHLLSMTGYGTVTLCLPLLWTWLALRPDLAGESWIPGYLVRIAEFNGWLVLTVAGVFVAAWLAWRLAVWMRAHLPWIYFAVGACILAGGLCSAALVNNRIKEYQRNRFLAFLLPQADPQGAAYNVHQALVAIGSGGLVGKGIFSGTQSQLGFLPERHTDFIFAVVGEEMGFLGASAVLGLYLLLVWRLVEAARLSRDRYGFLVCAGLASMFGFYLLINVGMCLGMLPVAGVPLPLVSYGGSSLVITLWALGIVSNIYSKRYAFLY